MAEFRNGENAAAIRDLRSGLDNAPDELSDNYDMQMYVEGLYYLALAYAEIGRPDQSRKLYRAILEIDPAHQGAIAGLAQG
jgi:tetratricopeptide (TPR) repeat protein